MTEGLSPPLPAEAAIRDLFRRYEQGVNAALAGEGDPAGMRDLYAESFIGATPAGVSAGQNDDTLVQAMTAGFAHYRADGATRFEIDGLRIQPIDALHALIAVDWVASYRKDGGTIPVPFTNSYLVQIRDGRAVVFGWITGDEQALLRQYGLGRTLPEVP